MVAHMLGDLPDRLSCRTQILSNLFFLWCSRQPALIQTGRDASKAFHHEFPKSAQFFDIGLLHDELIVFDSYCIARLHYRSARHCCPAVILLRFLPSIPSIRGTAIRKQRWTNLCKYSPEIVVGRLLQRDLDILMDRAPVRPYTRSAISKQNNPRSLRVQYFPPQRPTLYSNIRRLLRRCSRVQPCRYHIYPRLPRSYRQCFDQRADAHAQLPRLFQLTV